MPVCRRWPWWLGVGKAGVTPRLPYVRFPRHSNTEQKIWGLSPLNLFAVEQSKELTSKK